MDSKADRLTEFWVYDLHFNGSVWRFRQIGITETVLNETSDVVDDYIRVTAAYSWQLFHVGE